MSYRDYYSQFPPHNRSGGFFASLPPVVGWLLKINVAVFLLFVLLGQNRPNSELTQFLGLSAAGLKRFFFWQPFTYMFLHGGFGHLFFNMLTLYFLGPETERAMGSRHFLAMYLLSGLLGGLGWVWLSPPSVSFFGYSIPSICVGASGAIFGMLAAFATLFPRRRLTLLVFFVFPVTLMAWQLVAGLAVLEFLFASDRSSGVAHTAHLAGAFAGFLYVDQLFENQNLRRLWGRLRDYVAQRPREPSSPPPPPDRAEIDRILDKISAQGIQSLTREERQTLHRASRTF